MTKKELAKCMGKEIVFTTKESRSHYLPPYNQLIGEVEDLHGREVMIDGRWYNNRDINLIGVTP